MRRTRYNRLVNRPSGVANHSREILMSKLLLGSLVLAMLALSGLVAYNSFVAPTHTCPLSATNQDTSCCGTPTTGCCSEPKPDAACTAKEECPAAAAQQTPPSEPEKKDN
jgi:hypothetical protein